MSGEEQGVKPVAEQSKIVALPEASGLDQNFPNPYNPSTNIRYRLASDVPISLKIFDLTGREITSLAEGFMKAGSQEVMWNASQQPSGVCFVRLQAGSFISMRRIVQSYTPRYGCAAPRAC